MATKILLIEDNPKDRRLVEIALAEAVEFDYTLETAETLADGLGKVGDGTDIVLLDLNLPDAKGVDSVVRMRDACPQAPVIVLTGLEDRELGDEAIRLGAQDFLVKGKMFGELLWRAIRYSVERHRILEELRQAVAQQAPAP